MPAAYRKLAAPAIAALCASLVGGFNANAQTQPLPLSARATISHRVSAGDTLERLAERYLGDARQWQALQSHNRVPSPYRLQPGSILEIPANLLRSATASVDYVYGNAALTSASRSSAPAGQKVERGQILQEGDRLQLDPEAFVNVRLADGSTVRVQSSSDLQLAQLRRRGRTGSLQSVLELRSGGLEAQVPGKPDLSRRLEVITPVASSSVRGTRFDVQLDEQGRASTAVESGRVAVQALADAGRSAPSAELTPGYGLAVSAQGQAGTPAALLPAPEAADMPRLAEDAQWLELPLPTIAGAAGYRVAVSEDADGQQRLRSGLFAADKARFPALPDGQYQLQIRAVDAQGISGYSRSSPLRIKAHPVAGLPQSPAPGAMTALGEVQLLCTPVHGVQSYRMQVQTVPKDADSLPPTLFGQPLIDQVNAESCQLDLRTLPAGRYAWRTASIRQVDGQPDQGPFSAIQEFQVAARPAAPSADAMQTGSLAGVPQLFWPGEAGQRYRLQALSSPEASEPALDILLSEPQWTAAGLSPGVWFMRIQVQDPSGLHSAFSPPRSLRVLPLVSDGLGQAIVTGSGLGLESP